jgi:hypothetical protein
MSLASDHTLAVSVKTRKPTGLVVGRLHYSLCPTPSAHFRWGFRASELLCLLVREYWQVGGTIGMLNSTGQYVNLPI